jgi:hypothetical protein
VVTIVKRMAPAALTAIVLVIGSMASPIAAIVLVDGRVSPAAVSSLENAGGTVRLEQPRLETKVTVPEPRMLAQLVPGSAVLALLGCRRRRVGREHVSRLSRGAGGST